MMVLYAFVQHSTCLLTQARGRVTGFSAVNWQCISGHKSEVLHLILLPHIQQMLLGRLKAPVFRRHPVDGCRQTTLPLDGDL